MKKNIHVVGAVITDGDKILCAQRGMEKSLPGLWEFPGGKIETDETHLQALARELEEEVDLQIDQRFCELFKAVHHDYADKNVSLYFYLVKNASGIAKGMEDQPVLWVDAKTLSGLAIPDANKAIADALLETWPVS